MLINIREAVKVSRENREKEIIKEIVHKVVLKLKENSN